MAKSGTFANYYVKIGVNDNAAGGFVLINTSKGVKWGSFSTRGCFSDTLTITFDSANNCFYARAKEDRTGHTAYSAIVIAFSPLTTIGGQDNI